MSCIRVENLSYLWGDSPNYKSSHPQFIGGIKFHSIIEQNWMYGYTLQEGLNQSKTYHVPLRDWSWIVALFLILILNIWQWDVDTLHSGYLCLKIPATFSVISVFGSQKEAKNIEQGFTPGYKNVHFLKVEREQYQQTEWPTNQEASVEFKKSIEVEGDIKKVALEPRVPDRVVYLRTETNPEKRRSSLPFSIRIVMFSCGPPLTSLA
jgi:hypothetical protein